MQAPGGLHKRARGFYPSERNTGGTGRRPRKGNPVNVSLRTLEEMKKQLDSARSRVARVKAEASEAVEIVISAATVSGTSFGLGIINGRWGSPELLGVPVDAGVGIAAHVLAFMDIAPLYLHNVGNGGFGSYFSALGVGVGQKMAREARAPAVTTTTTTP